METITNKIVIEMQKSALKYGLDFEFISKSFFILSNKSKKVLFSETTPNTTSAPVGSITNNKYVTSLYLKSGDFPVPPSKIISTELEAREFVKEYGLSVIKPLKGIHGKGVTVGVNMNSDIKTLLGYASQNDPNPSNTVLIEKFVQGSEFRILIIGKSKVFLTKKEPAYITSNGKDTVKEQIKQLDLLPGFRKKIMIDQRVVQTLKDQGHDLSDIPDKDVKIIVNGIANIKSGGFVTSIEHPIPEEFCTLGVHLAEFLNMDVVGIDVIIDEHKKIHILEANVDPGIRLHMDPTWGPKYNVCDEIVSFFFKQT